MNITSGFKFDSLDKKIIRLLMEDGRMSYSGIARRCKLSPAAIHQRVNKMKEAGAFPRSRMVPDPKSMGFFTCAFIGLQFNLTSSRTHQEVYEKIMTIPEVVECHHTTGKYSLFIKIYARSNEDLKKIITERIQSIREVTGTETFISLEEGFSRELPVER